jgi:intergrase/recombinase
MEMIVYLILIAVGSWILLKAVISIWLQAKGWRRYEYVEGDITYCYSQVSFVKDGKELSMWQAFREEWRD